MTTLAETYNGFEIYQTNSRLACGWFVAGLRRPCRSLAHGKQIVDAHLSAKASQPQGVSIVAVMDGGNMLSAGECRNRIERQRGVWAGRKAAGQ
ncbi:hypothetical protein GCM10022631_12110 [Deinococcus rubellus]|uniref:Uncharacterized protein n=1 Tax=Deinococcus rubellus TaxID=1889240 RepID=A0ABY5YD54_9DEIO|nr:hypothetical protein [Deinococcus rubellus]UWX62743.1 hypothetical protein N0D28_08150 [Deinococcus rubellus]